MFKKVLVANRGEIAVRIFRTCRELGIATVAVHADVDREAPHVTAADEAVALGGDVPSACYLNADKLVAAAKETGAQAVHPGYGFLAENAGFAKACTDAGLVFIGPPAEAIANLGDKSEARRIAEKAGVPLIPGTPEPSEDLDKLAKEADSIGFPLMVKAAAGGGGKGLRKVDAAEELAEALDRASSEAKTAFGDGRLYMERYLERPRHVEVQILVDNDGNAVHLFERECSIQRRHQKIIEEAPSTAVDDDLRKRMGEAATKVVTTAGYRNAGTVEFLLTEKGEFFFMEVNARLQVEHPVTELITGVDLVALQLEIASGGKIPFAQNDLKPRGAAIECRLYAEDPEADFFPSPGDILAVTWPDGPGVRLDGGIRAGTTVPVHYDPILAKLITYGADRPTAIRRMLRALDETAILGVKTSIALLRDVVDSAPYRDGETNTDFLPEHFADWQPPAEAKQAGLLAYLATALEGRGRGQTSAVAASAGDTSAPSDPWDTLGAWRMEGDA